MENDAQELIDSCERKCNEESLGTPEMDLGQFDLEF